MMSIAVDIGSPLCEIDFAVYRKMQIVCGNFSTKKLKKSLDLHIARCDD